MENNIVSWITGKSDLAKVSLQELQDITHQYPYFTLAQLLLTVKMKKDAHPDYINQLQKTALNFQNPQWLHFQLESLESSISNHQILHDEAATATEEISHLSEEPIYDPGEHQHHIIEEENIEELATISHPSTNEENTIVEDAESENVEEILQNISPEQNNEEISQAVEEVIEISNDDTILDSQVNEISETQNEEIQIEDKEDLPIDDHPEESESRLSNILQSQVEAFKSTDVSQESLEFEKPMPLITKDYFASIGVTTDNNLNKDFGEKVKRFSDWLKQMKRVGTPDVTTNTEVPDEKIIIEKADASNRSSSVLTEAMAEVLIQQGKKQEAIAILEKLSLLKPEKSAYFASLIQRLKN